MRGQLGNGHDLLPLSLSLVSSSLSPSRHTSIDRLLIACRGRGGRGGGGDTKWRREREWEFRETRDRWTREKIIHILERHAISSQTAKDN